MVSFLKPNRAGRQSKQVRQRTTSISFSESDLAELGHIIAVGQVVFQRHPPVVARI